MRGRGLEQPGQLGGQPPWRADVAAAVDDDALLAVGKLERERGGMAGAGKPGRRRRADIAGHHRLAPGKPLESPLTAVLERMGKNGGGGERLRDQTRTPGTAAKPQR